MAKLRDLTEMPPMARGSAEEQLAELRDYLIRVIEELEYVLTHIEADNVNDTLFERIYQMIPRAYTGLPLTDGTASAGTQNAWSRGDHRHGTDTSRAAAADLTAHVEDHTNPHEVTKTQVGLGNVDNVQQYSASNPPPIPTPAQVGAIPATEKGSAGGVAELDANGTVPSAQLPSYVDDVLEYASLSAFPATGESGKIYIALDTNKSYRWSGSAYREIPESLALGETSSTAYRGDRGKTAYDLATAAIPSAEKGAASGVATLDADGKVPAAQIPALDVDTIPVKDSTKPITSGAVYPVAVWYGTCATAAATQVKTATISGITELSEGLSIRIIFTASQTYNGQPKLNLNNLGAAPIKRKGDTGTGANSARYEWLAGEVLDLMYDGSAWVIVDGGIATTTYYGYTKLSSSVTSTSTALAATPAAVKSAYDLAAAAIPAAEKGAVDGVASLGSDGKVPSSQLPTISSDAADISYDPTISELGATNVQDAIDEIDGEVDSKQDLIRVSGILKGDGQGGVSAAAAGTDYGTYSKPSGGIPKTDLASGVQTSLGLADTAYQKPSGGIPASDLASGVIPTVPSASTTNPAMDGNASPGSSVAWARGDHVHPSDTSRIPTSAKGVANGVATLDAAGKLPASQLPGIVVDAADVSYDGGTSGLPSTDVQGAIDDLNTFILDVEAEIPPVPSPSPTVPAMDGTASVGSEPLWARGDHIHPTDTSRVPTARTVNGKALSADITLDANDIDYDPSTSGLVAGTVQEAIDEFTLGTLSEIDRLDAAISARYTATTIYNTLTDVHSDTTITMDHSFTNYKFLMVVFNTRSPASASYRIPLVVSTNALPQGGFYAIANPDAQGYVRLNYVSGQAKQLRVQSTNFSALYIASVSGLT